MGPDPRSLSVDYLQPGYRDFNDYARIVAGVPVRGWGPQVNTANYSDHFLPAADIVYQLSPRTQLFASYAENYALPKGLDDIFAVALNSSAATVPAPAPEKSQNFELGVRTNQSQFYAALAGYYTRFENRIQSVVGILPGTINVIETFFQNVGRAEAYGVEVTGTFRPSALDGLAYFNANATYNHAKFKDDIPNVAAIAGKYLPDSAKWIVAGGVTVEPASWLVANVSGRYTSKSPASDNPMSAHNDEARTLVRLASEAGVAEDGRSRFVVCSSRCTLIIGATDRAASPSISPRFDPAATIS